MRDMGARAASGNPILRGVRENMTNLLKHFVREEQGQDVVEYALLVAGIGLVIFVGINTFGTRMNQIYIDLATAVDALVP
jgi:Flp pilus assembly pilin Flp